MLIIGHRGAKGLAPENTKKSLQSALDYNVDAIEIDVRNTADNVPVLNHDPFILNNGEKLYINKNKLVDLKRIKTNLITLDEAMRFIAAKKQLVIEIKPEVDTEAIVICIKNRLNNEWKAKDIKLSSFSYKVLIQMKKSIPEIDLIVNEKWSGVRGTRRAKKLNTKYITMNQRWLWGGFIKSLSRSNYKLSAYTVNDPGKAKKWAKYGLYAVITDYPDRFSS